MNPSAPARCAVSHSACVRLDIGCTHRSTEMFRHLGLRIETLWLLAFIAMFHAALSPSSRAELPVLAIDAIYPPAVSTAHASPLKVTAGRFTQDIESLVFSHPMIRATLDEAPPLPLDSVPQKQYGNFTVHVDPSVPEGFYEVWGVGRYGISNSRSLLIVHAPVQPLPLGTDPSNPPEAQPGICYFGQMKRNDRHAIRITSNGRWPRLSLVAAGIDSQTIPTWTLSDDQGHLLHQARSAGGQSLQWPASIPTPAGNPPKELTLKLYDFLFRGGENFAFVLMVDPPENHPMCQPYPGLPPTAVAMDGLADWPRATASTEPPVPIMPSPPWQTSLLIQPNAPPPSLEFTPIENQAYEVEVFSQVLDPSRDVRVVVDRPPPPPSPQQWSEIQQALQAAAGSPIDPAIQQRHDQYQARQSLLGRDVVAIAEDGPISGTRAVRFASSDPLLIIPGGTASKNVRLTLFDLQLLDAKAQPTHAIVRVGPAIPRFHAIGHWTPDTNNPVAARTTGSLIARGGSCAMHLSVRRAGGMSAPITVSVENLPPGLSAPPVVLAPNQTEAELIFFADENASSWTGVVTPIARASASDSSSPPSNPPPQEWTVPVRATTIHLSASGDRGLPQSRCSSQFLLKIVEQDVAPIQIRAGDGNAIQIPQGGTIPIPIRAVRRAGGEAKCILRPQNLPPKVTLAEFELAPNVNELNPEMKAATDAPLGESTIWFQVETTLKQALHPEAHSRTIAYRDRLQSMLADPSWVGDRPALEKTIAETNTRIEALAKEIAPRDFPTFLTTASLRVRVVAPPEPPK